MKKATTKCASCGGKMRGGGKVSTMKTKGFKAEGTTSKKKYAMGSTVMNTENCIDGDQKCKQKKKFGQMQFPKRPHKKA